MNAMLKCFGKLMVGAFIMLQFRNQNLVQKNTTLFIDFTSIPLFIALLCFIWKGSGPFSNNLFNWYNYALDEVRLITCCVKKTESILLSSQDITIVLPYHQQNKDLVSV